jgi:hypothetical protein
LLRHRTAAALLAILSIVWVVACRQGDKGKAVPSASAATESSGPRLKIDRAKIELGLEVQGDSLKQTMAIYNDGTASLVIERVDPSRSCSGTVDPTTIEPGRSGQLAMTCRDDIYDLGVETIVIHSNDPKTSVTAIQVVADVARLLAFDTQFVELKMPFGEERTADVHLVGALLGKARIGIVGRPVPDVEIAPQSSQRDAANAYRIHCKGRKVGMNSGSLILSTGLDRPKTLALSYSCKVVGTLDVSPANPYFNLKISGDKAVTITVRSSQPEFQIGSVQVTEGPFAARFERSGTDGSYRIDVTVLGDRLNDEARSASGKLLITSNDPTEPEKEVPLFGFGRVNKVTAPEPSRVP